MKVANNYMVLRKSNLDNLSRSVRRSIIDGWMPIGGIAIESEVYSTSNDTVTAEHYYCQALIKYKESDESTT